MQFRYPEILFALILLIIPIIVHLFQLRRFVKIPFTNVKFLKQIDQETRKSAVLKKWLVLISRLIALAFLIMAFAQPYLSNFEDTQEFHTIIYVDNSLSMQARGGHGELLKEAVQEIMEHEQYLSGEVTVFTNNESFQKSDGIELKNELMRLDYHPIPSDLETILLKIEGLKNNSSNTLYNTVLISDFQNLAKNSEGVFTNVNSPVSVVQMDAGRSGNIFIDSVYIDEESTQEINLKISVKSTVNTTQNVPVSIFEDGNLIGKSTAVFDQSSTAMINFTVPRSDNFKGHISLFDEQLTFDNNFYFSISRQDRIKVLSIGDTSEFLSNIYNEDEFQLTQKLPQLLDYGELQNQDLILLNELNSIPTELTQVLKDYLDTNGSLVCIPGKDAVFESYDEFLTTLQLGQFMGRVDNEHKITTINYDHPIFHGVFEKQVQNFQYPTSRLHYRLNSPLASPVLLFDNEEPFLSSMHIGKGSFYWVSGPMDKEYSNFTQFSLIVPIFYNMAEQSLARKQLYYDIDSQGVIEIKNALENDGVVRISKGSSAFIPLQQISGNKIRITLTNQVLSDGFYELMHEDNSLQTLAFNYGRSESLSTQIDLNALIANNPYITAASDLTAAFDQISNNQQIRWLFKWFLLISVLFLLIEMLLLKYFNI